MKRISEWPQSQECILACTRMTTLDAAQISDLLRIIRPHFQTPQGYVAAVRSRLAAWISEEACRQHGIEDPARYLADTIPESVRRRYRS